MPTKNQIDSVWVKVESAQMGFIRQGDADKAHDCETILQALDVADRFRWRYPSKGEWPKVDEVVLDEAGMRVYLDESGRWVLDDLDRNSKWLGYTVTAWMPLPEWEGASDAN